MGRLIKIVIFLTVMALLYFWLVQSFSGCGNNSASEITDTIIAQDSLRSGLANEDEIFESEETNEGDVDDLFESNENEGIDYTALDEVIDKSFETKQDPDSFEPESNNDVSYTPPSSNRTYTNTSDGYLIIAGSYLMEANAMNMVRKLNNMGFSAEKLIFDNSEYHSVIAGRFADYGEAVDAVSSLKNRGIDCYVHRKKM